MYARASSNRISRLFGSGELSLMRENQFVYYTYNNDISLIYYYFLIRKKFMVKD